MPQSGIITVAKRKACLLLLAMRKETGQSVSFCCASIRASKVFYIIVFKLRDRHKVTFLIKLSVKILPNLTFRRPN